jgi:hypothetical protein
MKICQHCGQEMRTKFGVRFTRTQAAILDRIEKATEGRGGIDGATLGWVLFPGLAVETQKNRIRVHVCQINDMLVSTDWHIVNTLHNRNGSFYKLVEIEKQVA